MKANENERLALRTHAARSALRKAIGECVRVLTEEAARPTDAPIGDVALERSVFKLRVQACVEVLREGGIRETELLPSIRRAVSSFGSETGSEVPPEITRQIIQWSDDALAPKPPWINPVDQVESTDLGRIRVEVIGSMRDAYVAPALGTFQNRRLRAFDATWNKMEWEVRRFARCLRANDVEHGAALAEVKATFDEAVPGLALNHPMRASVIDWFTAAYAGRS